MKFTPEVIAALQVLRDNATNDFERHRIDVLERDLTAPPTVEVLDDTHQKFNGVVYYKSKSGHFSTKAFIHRVVWQYYHGEIPDGYQIHHADQGKSNNNSNNLICLSAHEHQKLHSATWAIHRFTCNYCGKEFSCKQFNFDKVRFCSRKCYKAWCRREKPIKKVCVICGKEFNTYDNIIKCCSQSCAKIATANNQRKDRTTQCEFCGVTFVAKKNKIKFCSKSCAQKGRWQKYHNNN